MFLPLWSVVYISRVIKNQKFKKLIESQGQVIHLVAGPNHSLALTESGKVYAWGWNEDGQLGVGHMDNCRIPTKVNGLPKGLPQNAWVLNGQN